MPSRAFGLPHLRRAARCFVVLRLADSDALQLKRAKAAPSGELEYVLWGIAERLAQVQNDSAPPQTSGEAGFWDHVEG